MMKKEGNNWFWAYWAKTDPYNDENVIEFKWSDVTEENGEDIALANFIESLHKQADEEIFPKK